MKLLMENWREFLNEDPAQREEFLTLLNEQRQKQRNTQKLLREGPEETVYNERELPIGQIYCDMDGVLADFTGGFLNLVKQDLANIKGIKTGAVHLVGLAGKFEYTLKRLKDKIKNVEAQQQDSPGWEEVYLMADEYFETSGEPNWWVRLFKNLPPLPAGMELWALIGPYRPILLTSAPLANILARKSGGKEAVKYAKIQWAKENLMPPPKDVILQSNKSPYAWDKKSQKPNLLIDDWSHNLKAWDAAGGKYVKFNEADSKGNLRAVNTILVGGHTDLLPTWE